MIPDRVLQARSKPLIAGSYIRVRCKPHQYDVQRQSSVWSSYIACPLGLDCLCTHKRCGTGLIEIGETLPFTRRTDAFARNVVRVFPAARSRFRFPWTRGITAYTNTHRVTRVPTCLRASYGAIPLRSAGHASGIGSKASIGRDLCNDTRCRPRGRLSHHLVYVLWHGTPEAFLSLESSPVETRKPRDRYVIIPYAHDSFYSM